VTPKNKFFGFKGPNESKEGWDVASCYTLLIDAYLRATTTPNPPSYQIAMSKVVEVILN